MADTTTEAARDLALRAAAFDALPSQIAVLDHDGVIRATNGAWADFAVDNEVAIAPEMVGQNYLSACEGTDDEDASAAAAGIRAVIEGDSEHFSFEYPCHSPDERRWFTMRAIPVTHDGEAFVLVVHTDITDRREAELAVRERNDSLGLLAGILSHDLRNPLGVALGRAEMLEDGEHAAAIRSSLERMNDIIEDALVLARDTELGETAAVDLETVAGDAWEHVATGEATLSVEGSMMLSADATMLMQALENLFRNAIDHAGDGVTVTVGPLSDGTGFFVADDGPGIPAEERDSVFEPGYTTASADGGTGLGLAIVDRVATAHGWDVAVTESVSGGARFEFTGVDIAD